MSAVEFSPAEIKKKESLSLQKRKQILLFPSVTLKSAQLAKKKCYTFVVASNANKYQIAEAFTLTYGGKVSKINTTAIRASEKRTKKGIIRKSDGKKAYIYTDIELDIFPKF